MACISASISAIVRGRIDWLSVGVICALRSAGEDTGDAFTGWPSGLACETEPTRRVERTGEDDKAAGIDPFRDCG